ncbi:adenylate/guanylate cyclase domain-containing protein [Mesorhizobium erdmanii]|uniref:Adenylate/guanylate cyclase domain-containing protein n=2 Tax=Mesorhizobium TaxID=68287 RepID=A0A3M9X1S6_9HYPH|nr:MULTISPECIES: adenylate/guanylate cyclase domain-containing protein [Mesorhizobium]RNJ41468.1 adenylate/guanylate cyclase domain-containing protein [Mesorhizobium japonicum]RXT53350.1 adenylate/guanylate cyclase domain-containing protein [Mesorhizobium erdmanii]
MRLLRVKPILAGVASSALSALSLLSPLTSYLDVQREQFFDTLTQWIPPPRATEISVVDFDLKSFREDANHVWDRSDVASVVAKISEGGARAIAIDIVFGGTCDPGEERNNALAQAIASAPVTLGFLIGDNTERRPKAAPPVGVLRPVTIPPLWFIDGAETSCSDFQMRARSVAAAFLVGDKDAHVRRAQAFVVLSDEVYPALGIEAARVAFGTRPPIIGGDPVWVRLAKRRVELDADGSFRFASSSATAIAARTVSAADVLNKRIVGKPFADKIVFIGSSLPQLGGLRPTASMPLEPSVQIHADIANAVITGFIPHRDSTMPIIEAFLTFLGGCLMALIGTRTRPIISTVLGLLLIAGIFGAAVVTYAKWALLFDAIGLSLSLIAALACSSISQFASTCKAEARARYKLSQYLPRSVVERYINSQKNYCITYDERQVTALFTDIEGFCLLSRNLSPCDIVALLNIYYAEVNELIASHGGMVDKVVGDAVHAFFNAPEDLPNHVNKAFDCAEAIQALTGEMRKRPNFAKHKFGRTRIGIETGTAVLGEVGGGAKLDYTAHGSVVNLAARLQEANKTLGTAICIGPNAAAQSGRTLQSLDVHQIPGFGKLELFTTPLEAEASVSY